MIAITGTIPTRADKHDEAVAAMIKMQDASLAEPGCNKYQFGFTAQDPSLAIIFEEWVDQAALDAHFRDAAHGRVPGCAERHCGRSKGNLTRYEVSSSGPLG